ncbi:hypothetical protein QAD02_014078 [Eretmocerus hayati]|uniref:Uncharacterized protein n=1 Tax=Eretmocerus hayati TaxID=131215 RepID=A0ACC2P4D8_9HYME|nr:hypothetical protein QAD02_014078 [Eretmocerus hayati]
MVAPTPSKRPETESEFGTSQSKTTAQTVVELVLGLRGDLQQLGAPLVQTKLKAINPRIDIGAEDAVDELKNMVSQIKIFHTVDSIVGLGVVSFRCPVTDGRFDLLSFVLTRENSYSYVCDCRLSGTDLTEQIDDFIYDSIEIVKREYNADIWLVLYKEDADFPSTEGQCNESTYYVIQDLKHIIDILAGKSSQLFHQDFFDQLNELQRFVCKSPKLPEAALYLYELLSRDSFKNAFVGNPGNDQESWSEAQCLQFLPKVCAGAIFLCPSLQCQSIEINVHYNRMKAKFLKDIGWYSNNGKYIEDYAQLLQQIKTSRETMDREKDIKFWRDWANKNPGSGVKMINLIAFPATFKECITPHAVQNFASSTKVSHISLNFDSKLVIFNRTFQ